MNYTIRPIEPRDAEGAAALRRMPGVFENTTGLPSCRTADSEAFIAGTARRSSPGWGPTTTTSWRCWRTAP